MSNNIANSGVGVTNIFQIVKSKQFTSKFITSKFCDEDLSRVGTQYSILFKRIENVIGRDL